MNKNLIACLILVVILYTPIAFTVADGPDYWQVHGVAGDDALNIRSDANAKAEKVGEIPADSQCIKNIKCVGGLTMEEFTKLADAEKERLKRNALGGAI